MPDDWILMVEAASRLAYGDDDFIEHRAKVYSAKKIAVGNRTEVYELTHDWIWPGIDRVVNWLIKYAEVGELKVKARKCNESSGVHYPIPSEFWRFDDWTVGCTENHPIYRPIDPADKSGGPDTAEWCYPKVRWSEVGLLLDRKRAPKPNPTNPALRKWMLARVADWPLDKAAPTEAADIKAASEHFENLDREDFRIIRRACAPAWLKQGPRQPWGKVKPQPPKINPPIRQPQN